MVEEQIVSRGISSKKVTDAMKRVPRHLFVNEKYQGLAYSDQPLPIGHGQTISQPYVVAFMTEALDLDENSRVLEVGTGCGYQTAIIAEIAKEVYTVEIIKDLLEVARRNLKKLGYSNIKFKLGNGREGWQEYALYSHIIVTAASDDIPEHLIKQLEIKGKIIIPVGPRYWTQNLVLVTKYKSGIKKKKLLPVNFVPLVGSRNIKN
jgi:protein-L-isoaspartate(D-aspartate) O-methyltransferase